ncbi:MAG: hypothetical protein K6F01_08755 [Selenomonas sp.]|uniref:hypothetical protein n=1 Tax=Selenomonas sp. TaxID=2053611 RepID=UPI0025F53CE6|nr:hypothetical protein [Selenomonas sp.]MCR5439503.1 hypothetical protein [Selenomonas sp.]
MGERQTNIDLVLKPKIKQIVCSLGVGEYFAQWDLTCQLSMRKIGTRRLNWLRIFLFISCRRSIFALSRHPWQEPYQRILQASQQKDYNLLTPEIGALAYIDSQKNAQFDLWWENME